MHASPQLTPAQLLESGRRSETEGKLDLASQFYRYLIEHYAQAPEAEEARHAIGRIGAIQAQAWQTHDAGPGGDGAQSTARGPRRRPAAPRRRYRTGRMLAQVIMGAGWMVALTGLSAPALYVALASGLPSLGLPELIGATLGSVAGGLLMALAGHAACALFDQANAMLEVVALERAKLGRE